MRIAFFVAFRFLRAKRRDRTISAITWISTGGVMLGVMALIITISTMNGFRENLFIAVSGNTPHLRILPSQGMLSASALRGLEARLRSRPDVLELAPYLFRQAFVAVGDEFRVVFLRGIDPHREGRLTELSRFIGIGQPVLVDTPVPEPRQVLERLVFPPPAGEQTGILLGAPLARSLGLFVGDRLRVISSVERQTPIGPVPLIKEFVLVGTFDTGLSGKDELHAYVDYRIAQRLFRLGDASDGLGLRMADPEAMDVQGLRAALPGMRVVSWGEEHKNIFQVMRLEKMGLFLILTLIIVVSFFNIISCLVMLVLEKRKAIAIIKTMGVGDGTVRRIFFVQGLGIGALGTLGGLLLGLAACWVLATFDWIHFPPGVFPLTSRLPIRVEAMDVLAISIASLTICMLVTLYPATRAARMQPVENLRHE